MKIRTLTELLDKLDEIWTWRKKELIDYKSLCKKNKDTLLLNPITRAGIALTYAHWEGFIKESSECYLSYLSSLRLKHNDLSLNLIALAFFNKIKNAKDFEKCYEVVHFLKDSESRCQLPKSIETDSNLNSVVLKKITQMLGLNYTEYETRANFIDINLLAKRNEIAHGEYRKVDFTDFNEAFEFVLKYCEIYKTEIENAATLKKYGNTK